MKKLTGIFAACICSVNLYSQCNVTIVPQSATTFCAGNSVVLTANTSGAAAGIDQSATVYNSGISALSMPGYSFWQSFTAGATGTLTQLDIGFFNFINGVGTLNIHQGTGTGGSLLSTQTVNVNCPSGNCLLSFTIAGTVNITAGNVYTFHFTPGAGIPNPYGVQADVPGSYAGGTHAIVDPSGTYQDWDVVFNTHVLPTLYVSWSTGSTNNTITVSSGGNYIATVTDSMGCTSDDTLLVTVNTVDTSVTQSGFTLTANATSATYQWLDCGNANVAVGGANAQNFTPSTNGMYSVVVTQNGCSDTSDCRNVTGIGISEIPNVPFNLYPNPSTGKFTIETTPGQRVVISNALGKVEYQSVLTNARSEINFSQKPAGMYFIRIITAEKTYCKKLVIK